VQQLGASDLFAPGDGVFRLLCQPTSAPGVVAGYLTVDCLR